MYLISLLRGKEVQPFDNGPGAIEQREASVCITSLVQKILERISWT